MQSAYKLRQSLEQEDRKELQVVYGIFDLVTHRVWTAPPADSRATYREVVLADAPSSLAEFEEFGYPRGHPSGETHRQQEVNGRNRGIPAQPPGRGFPVPVSRKRNPCLCSLTWPSRISLVAVLIGVGVYWASRQERKREEVIRKRGPDATIRSDHPPEQKTDRWNISN